MKAFIEHESRGRLRVRMKQYRMTLEQADLLEAYLQNQPGVLSATVHERTCCAVIRYIGDRENIIRAIAQFNYTAPSVTALTPTHSGRALNREYQEKLVGKVITKFACTLFLPAPLQIARTIWLSLPFLGRGLKRLIHRELKVELLDALSIGVSMVRRDFSTAGSVMFLLDIGELLEEWTHKKSVDDLARCMSLNVKRVWLKTDDAEVLVPLSNIAVGDHILVRMGSVIPLDGEVVEGEVMVNQASLTGESMPVAKRPGTQVYAGTVIEEGDCVIEVTQSSGESRYDKIVSMIEQSEQLKSAAESHAANLADKLVPYTLIGSALSYALTRNVTRALSVLMVDFSCALKLAMPLAVLSAMREASMYHITVKGGKFLEAVAQADTIVFDKTGTLTHACPVVARVIPFGGRSEDDMLRIGDWIEMPQNNINGTVIDISLDVVKVQNFDNTIVTVPPYSLVSGSFINWRGMSDSGGRRIMREYTLKLDYIKPCTPEFLEKMKAFDKELAQFITEKQKQAADGKVANTDNPEGLVNGTIDTNLGLFRAYMSMYLRRHPFVSKELLLMVRTLPPVANGLPVQIYCFSSNKNWPSYESIQAEIMEHFVSVLPAFELYPFQNADARDMILSSYIESAKVDLSTLIGIPWHTTVTQSNPFDVEKQEEQDTPPKA